MNVCANGQTPGDLVKAEVPPPSLVEREPLARDDNDVSRQSHASWSNGGASFQNEPNGPNDSIVAASIAFSADSLRSNGGVAGSEPSRPESSRVQDFTTLGSNPEPPSSLDALALACAAQDKSSRNETTPLTMDTSASSTPIASNKSHSTDATKEQSKSDNSADAGSPSFQLTNNDVLCGRGGLTNHHPGNVFFRRLVRMRQEDYLRASKRDKAGVARDIVDTIRKLDPPGRFLKKDPTNPGVWVEIGNRKAREKTSQALREGAPELREELSNHAGPNGTHGTHTAALDVFTQTAITQAEMEQAARASLGCVPRARVVSSDDDDCAAGFVAPFQEMQGRREAFETSGTPHVIADEAVGNNMTPMVTPTTLTPSSTFTSTSSLEPMDTSIPEPPLFCGTKRKHEHSSCSIEDQQMQEAEIHRDGHQRSPGGTKRGPRLRIFKERMMELCH